MGRIACKLTSGAALVIALLLSLSRAEAEDSALAYSLVIGGQLRDVPAVFDPSTGSLISASALTIVADIDGHISVATHPARGHIVMSSPADGKNVSPIKDFKTATVTLVANGNILMSRGRLVDGVPFIEATVLQTVLESLKFNVLVSHESRLISVFRPEPAESTSGNTYRETSSASSPASPPQDDLLQAVQQATQDALRSMGVGQTQPVGQPVVASDSSAASGVCGAMDELRGIWEETEPSAYEKNTFRSLADKFQEAKDNHDVLEPEDVDRILETLQAFRKKVDRRTRGTQGWTAPDPAARVKSYGNSFLDSFSQAMDLSQQMVESIKAQDQTFVEQAEDLIQQLKGLERTIQDQGTRFNNEVIRVRNLYGCGPAKLGLPPS